MIGYFYLTPSSHLVSRESEEFGKLGASGHYLPTELTICGNDVSHYKKMFRITATLLVLFCSPLKLLIAEEVEERNGSIRRRQHELYGIAPHHRRNLYVDADVDDEKPKRELAEKFDDLNAALEWERILESEYENMSMDCIPINSNSKKSKKSSKASKKSKGKRQKTPSQAPLIPMTYRLTSFQYTLY